MAPTSSTVNLKKKSNSSGAVAAISAIESQPLVDRGELTAPYIDGTAIGSLSTSDVGFNPAS